MKRHRYPSLSPWNADYEPEEMQVPALKRYLFKKGFYRVLKFDYWPWFHRNRLSFRYVPRVFPLLWRLGLRGLAKKLYLKTSFKYGWVIFYDDTHVSRPKDRSMTPHEVDWGR